MSAIIDETGRIWTDGDTVQQIDFKLGNGALQSGVFEISMSTAADADLTLLDHWTFDFWVKFTDIFHSWHAEQVDDSATFDMAIYPDNEGFGFAYCSYDDGVNSWYFQTDFLTISTDEWHHFAFVRDGADGLIFMDGIKLAMDGGSTYPGAINCVFIDSDFVIEPIANGFMDEFRFSNDNARWTGDFIPSVVNYSVDADTVCLLHFDVGSPPIPPAVVPASIGLSQIPTLRAEILQRDGSRPFLLQSSNNALAPKVKSYSFGAIGGPLRAEMEVKGGRDILMAYLNSLRCPVKIYDHLGNVVWWGYIHEAEIQVGNVKIGVSLESMTNKIGLIYAKTVAPSYIETTTGELVHRVYNPGIVGTILANDATSIAEYGTKEARFDAQSKNYTKVQAEGIRDALLNHRKYPIPTVTLNDSGDEDHVTLYCHGWWDTLGWQYYKNEVGLYSYTNGGGGKATVGDAADSLGLIQQFHAPEDNWYPNVLKLNCMKEGAPGAALKITFFGPGGVMARAFVPEADIPNELGWVDCPLVPDVAWGALNTLDLYYVELQGNWIGIQPNDFYWAALDTGKAPPSGFYEWNGGAWVTRPKDADGHMLMQINDELETIQQLSDILTASAQFMTGSVILDTTTTGINSCQYRDGSRTALDEILDLLNAGTTNDRRMLATWDADNNVHLKEEPANTVLQYIYHKNGTLTNMFNMPVANYFCPAGCWMRIDEVVDVDAGFMADATRMFIEEAEYDAETGEIRLTAKDDRNPLDAIVLYKPGLDIPNSNRMPFHGGPVIGL